MPAFLDVTEGGSCRLQRFRLSGREGPGGSGFLPGRWLREAPRPPQPEKQLGSWPRPRSRAGVRPLAPRQAPRQPGGALGRARTHAHPHTHACTHAHMHTRARTCTHTRMHVCTRGGTDALGRASGTGRGGAGGGDAAGTDAPPACLSHPWPLGHPSTVPCLSPGFVFRESALGRRAAPSRCSARPRARHTRLKGPARLQASPAPGRPPSPNRVPPDPRPGSTCRSAPPGVMAWARRGPSARSRAPGPPPSLRGPSGCVLSAAGAAAGWRRVDVCQIFTSLLNDAERPVEPPLGKPRTPNAERPVNPSTSSVPGTSPRCSPHPSPRLASPPSARPPPWTPAPRSADSKARRRECPRPEGKGQRSPGEHVLHAGREKPAGLRARDSVARASLGRGPRARSRGGG